MIGSLSKRLRAIVFTGAVLALSACGGKQDATEQNATAPASQKPPPVILPTTSVWGVFDGTFTDTGQAVTALVETDGTYYLVYSNANQSPAGAIVGSSTISNGSVVSTDATDLSLIGHGSQTSPTGTLNGSLSQGRSFNGVVTYNASQRVPVAFSTTFNSAFTTLPPLSALAGTYAGAIATRSLKEDQLELTITANGAVSSKLSCGCNVTATLAPRSDNTAYIATFQFVGGNHPLTNKSMAGNVYFDAARKRVYIVGNINGAESALFVGTKR